VQREENPLFLVRYAHARARALERGARALGVRPEPRAVAYAHPRERELLGLLGEPVAPEPSGGRLARRLRLVADAFLETERARPTLPAGDEKPGAAHRARLALAQATGVALAGGLRELGISAPERL
jgi:arginyl-tRNA synthetase